MCVYVCVCVCVCVFGWLVGLGSLADNRYNLTCFRNHCWECARTCVLGGAGTAKMCLCAG